MNIPDPPYFVTLLPVVNVCIWCRLVCPDKVEPVQEIKADKTTDSGSPSGTPHRLECGLLNVRLKCKTRFMEFRKSIH